MPILTKRFILHALLHIALCGLAILLLLTLLDHHLENPSVHALDLSIQTFVHDQTSSKLTAVMLAFTQLGSVKIFLTGLAAVVILLYRRLPNTAAVLALSLGGAFFLNETLKLYFHRLRPKVPWSIGDEHTYSFPSGHSLFSVVLYGTLAYIALRHAHTLRRRIEVIVPAVLLPLCIGSSRIYLGMHYPTDVLGGYLTGILWLTTVILIDREWHRIPPAESHPVEQPLEIFPRRT